jgi:hypothetical protein
MQPGIRPDGVRVRSNSFDAILRLAVCAKLFTIEIFLTGNLLCIPRLAGASVLPRLSGSDLAWLLPRPSKPRHPRRACLGLIEVGLKLNFANIIALPLLLGGRRTNLLTARPCSRGRRSASVATQSMEAYRRVDLWAPATVIFQNESTLNLEILRRCFSFVGHFVEFDNLPLIPAGEAGLLDSRDMHKHIFSAASLRLNKAVPFLRVEPLHGAARHCRTPLLMFYDSCASSALQCR